MLDWKTNLFLLALGLIYPVVMLIKDLSKKKKGNENRDSANQKSDTEARQ